MKKEKKPAFKSKLHKSLTLKLKNLDKKMIQLNNEIKEKDKVMGDYTTERIYLKKALEAI